MPFPQAPVGAWRILGGWQRSGWIWCCGRSCWWCPRRMTKRSSPAGSGRRRGPVREGYKVVAFLLKLSLGLFWLVGWRQILLPHPGSASGHLIAPGCPRGVMVKAMNCGIVVREFVLQSRYYVHFLANTLGKGMNPLILPPAMGK